MVREKKITMREAMPPEIMHQFLEEMYEKERREAEQQQLKEECHWDKESVQRAKDLISKMLDHVSMSVAQREGKRTMPEHDEQDEGKSEDSSTSYEVEPGMDARIQGTTIDGHGWIRRQRRHEESSRILTSDEEAQPVNAIEGKPHLHSKETRGPGKGEPYRISRKNLFIRWGGCEKLLGMKGDKSFLELSGRQKMRNTLVV